MTQEKTKPMSSEGRKVRFGLLPKIILFMVAALDNDELIHEAPAIVGCRTPSALAHAADAGPPTSHGPDGCRRP